jgi:two-component system OmpR family response regulator
VVNIHVPVPLILIVEDEWLLRLELTTALEEAGWTVLEANSGESGLAILKQRPSLSALITDIRLGGTVNGWQVAETARAQAPLLPVIYVSADAPNASLQVARSTFFSKPIQFAKLLPVCAAFLAPRI